MLYKSTTTAATTTTTTTTIIIIIIIIITMYQIVPIQRLEETTKVFEATPWVAPPDMSRGATHGVVAPSIAVANRTVYHGGVMSDCADHTHKLVQTRSLCAAGTAVQFTGTHDNVIGARSSHCSLNAASPPRITS